MTLKTLREQSGAAIANLMRRSRPLHDILEPAYSRAVVARWLREGRPIPPPPAVKRAMLLQTARKRHLCVLVETGTFRGDTVAALRHHFSRVVSVELSSVLHAQAARRVRGAPGTELLLGDSAEVLPQVLATLREPALFWLDAHYSGGVTAVGSKVSPIEVELDAVLGHPVKGHVILIDDAREFHDSARSGYPGLEAVTGAAHRHGYAVSEKDDIFFLLPPS